MKNKIGSFNLFLLTQKRMAVNTVLAYSRDIDQFALYCNEYKVKLSSLSSSDIKRYLQWLAHKNIGARTRARKLVALKCFIAYVFSNTKVEKLCGSIVNPKIEKRLPNYLTFEEIKLLLKELKKKRGLHKSRNRLLIYLLYACGIRASELCAIQLNDIDLNSKTLHVNGKGNRERLIPIPASMVLYIEDYINGYHADFCKNYEQTLYLFPVFYRNKIVPITRQSLGNILKELWKKTGINKPISPHMLRHTYATHMLMNGANLRQLQMLLGHERLSSVEIYTHLDITHLRKEYDKAHPRA